MAILMPALDGRDPLGFLAAVGVLRLVANHDQGDTALSFDPDVGVARLHTSTIGDVDELASVLAEVFDSIDDGGAIPGMPPDFPPPGAAPDRLRVPPEQIGPLAHGWIDPLDEDGTAARWVRALVTDIAVDVKGHAAITPYAAPSGKQSFSTMFAKTNDAVRRRPSSLREALAGWRRVPGYTGEYLDHRVLVSGADAPSAADAVLRGVPGATWLALMALPSFPVTASNGRRAAPGWQRIARRQVMRWPLWYQRADLAAVSTLLTHPALELADVTHLSGGMRASATLRRLSVFCVAVALRKPGKNSDGALVPQHVIAV